MFVPELGQPDGNIYRNVSINDLVFRNPRDRAFELLRETSLKHFSLRRFINWLCGLEPRPRTLGGLLFAPGRI